jgi:hypothetical protein
MSNLPNIKITYSQTTPESANDGDFSDSGWINEEGVEFTETNEELIEEVVTYLRNEGVCEASSSMFRKGIWYSTEWFVEDYGTMTEEQDSYHLYNFSEEQERTIYNELKSKRII